MRVLVVDDEPDVRHLLEILLGMAGADVDVAEHGEAGMAAMEAHRYDVVVLDLMMPVLDGWGVLHRLGDGVDPAVIVASARGDADTRKRALQAGAVSFVEKPFDPETLARLVEMVGTETGDARRDRRRTELIAYDR